MREHVCLLYIIEGGTYLRAHSGTCFYYSNGAFRPFTGVPPQGVLSRVKDYLLQLEGLYRSLPPKTQRSEGIDLLTTIDRCMLANGGPDACVAAWVSKALKMVGLPRTSKGGHAESEGEEGDAGREQRETNFSWPATQAYAISRGAAALQRELLSKSVIAHFIEWCETESPALPGVAFEDVCFRFDTPDGHLEQVKKSPGNHCYTAISHSIMKSEISAEVLKRADERMRLFIATTFWKNEDAYRCQLAAMGLVLRGRNVDRAFWTKGPGGVGQSLNSHLIAAMFGRSHEFLDMNVYYSDDELRKQCDTLVTARIHTGQEAVQSNKTTREDLCKKHISADPVVRFKNKNIFLPLCPFPCVAPCIRNLAGGPESRQKRRC